MGSQKPARLPTTTLEIFHSTTQRLSQIPMFPHERKMQQLQQQRQLVEQLRREAAINRITVSQACKDLQKYCTDHGNEDFLIKGFASQKQNPFREKSSCALL